VPEPEDGGIQTHPEQVQNILDTGLSVGGEPPQVCATDHHGTSTERERLGDVPTATDATVQEYLKL
tara:strand:+ start:410 stop:607 length:198 start_codon:yes stop_codon:yes gene_type:complete